MSIIHHHPRAGHLREATCLGVFLAIRFSIFGKKSFPFQVNLTSRAVKALRVPVLVECLHPAIAGFDRKLTSSALSLEHDLPILFTIHFAVFDVEASTTDRLVTLWAQEATRAERVVQGIHALPHDFSSTFSALWSEVFLVILLTQKLASLFDEAHAEQRTFTVGVWAVETARTPRLV